MFRIKLSSYATVFLISIVLIVLMENYTQKSQLTQLQTIQSRGAINVSTLQSTDTYYLKENQPAGFEFELVQAFANFIGVKLELSVETSLKQVIGDINNKNSQIAMLGPHSVDQEDNRLSASNSFAITQSVVVYRVTEGSRAPISLEQLAQKSILAAKDPLLIEQLNLLKSSFPSLKWRISDTPNSEILQQLSDKKTQIAILSKREFSSIGAYFPRLKVAFTLPDIQPIHWLTRTHSDQSVLDAINNFLKAPTTQQLIQQLEHKYYFNNNPLNLYDTLAFKQAYINRLPKLEPYFKQAALKHNIDWKLLASIAYQESHWNPNAVSPTGVKGIMMLTNAAAKEVGVTDRTDPIQSILGGTKYLRSIQKKIPSRIPEPQRTFFALAAYNIGYGHLEDARILAQRAGLDPDSWEDVNKMLPRLTKAKYYTTVKHGYARGYEPVNYVKNIKEYLTIFKWQEKQQQLEDVKETTVEQYNAVPQKSDEKKIEAAPSTL